MPPSNRRQMMFSIICFTVVFIGFAYLMNGVNQLPPPVEEGQTVAFGFTKVGSRQQKTICTTAAVTEESLKKGLTDTTAMPDNKGLLYYYPKGERPQFWGKDMQHQTEVWWLQGKTVAGVAAVPPAEEDVPDEQLKRTISPVEVDAVIEVNVGTAERLGLQSGDVLRRLEAC